MKKQPTKLYTDIDMNFTKNFISGDIGKKTDVHAIRQALKNIIYTNINERPFDPTWGSQIREILFEPVDVLSSGVLENLIEQAIENHEPRCQVEHVRVTASEDDNSYNAEVYFHVIGIKEMQKLGVVLSRLR
jgi:phage baseplate assembly protein W